MKLKGFKKLTLQIFVLSASMIALSFITETEVFKEYFEIHLDEGICNVNGCGSAYSGKEYNAHSHYNYRGIIYIITGVAYFILSVFKIFLSHKDEDFLK